MQTVTFFKDNIRFLLFGVLMAACSSIGQTYFIGIYRPSIMQEYGLSDTSFGGWYLIITLGSAVGLNRLGYLLDHISLRRWVAYLVLGVVAASLFVATSLNFAMVIIGLVFVRMIGQGLMTHTAITSMSRYFEKNRGRAVSIAVLGMPIGQSLFPLMAVSLMTVMTWRSSWAVMSVAYLFAFLPLFMVLLKGHEDRHTLWKKEVEQDAEDNDAQQSISLRRADVIKDPKFYLLIPVVLASPFWLTAVFFFAETIATSKGWSMLEYTALYWVNALGAVLVALIAGSLVDRHGGMKLMVLPNPLLALAILTLILSDGLLGATLFMLLIGIASGLAIPINNTVWAELYGTRYLGEIKALTMSIFVVSTALAPFVLGALMDIGVKMDAILWAGVAHGVLSIPLVWLVRRRG